MHKIGLIQTRGIGDIIIAAPIAQKFIDEGHEVHWPVDSRFFDFVQRAFPEIKFLPVDALQTGEASIEYFYTTPLQLLQEKGCDRIHCLYSHLSGLNVVDEKLAKSLKFDEYKYAVAGVDFSNKWFLRIKRDPKREQDLTAQLNIRGPYALLHEEGSNFRVSIQIPQEIRDQLQVIHISAISSNPFDWISVIENASFFACVDSCFANLAEQLNLCKNKYLLLRSDVRFTPVFKNGWKFV